ncbi:uncharacterized protein GlcG (DUF336 family) [Ilumatobacter fluminis]|uniref:Uncharacterized protein GlcG (DUF336 family) n=1 Tax=Ilumatobacter fluminis TaxID=467091 RepID=A0A4R7HWK1_9ACTN|nr:heme-binding protein [Ilumatobacter fluminis]TDT14924.1 uncharacterized protein GlcG (DUF336 family) [Ilumatobacter fluminis]
MSRPTRALVDAVLAGVRSHAQSVEVQPLCIAIVDAGAHLVAAERWDGAAPGRFDVAVGKARAAVLLGVSSRRLGEMAIERPHFLVGLTSALGPIVPVAGGVLIVDGDTPVGAIGISGDTSDNDELAAIAGIRAAGLEVGL